MNSQIPSPSGLSLATTPNVKAKRPPAPPTLPPKPLVSNKVLDIQTLSKMTYLRANKRDRPKLSDIFSNKSPERLELDEAVQFSGGLLKVLIHLLTQFKQRNRRYIAFLHRESDKDSQVSTILAETENDWSNFSVSILGIVSSLIGNLRIYDERTAVYDRTIRPCNALVTSIVNMRPRFDGESDTAILPYIESFIERSESIVTELLINLRNLTATQLCIRHQQGGPAGVNACMKRAKILKLVGAQRKLLLKNSVAEELAVGVLLKKSKNEGSSFSKNWKKYKFKLEWDRLLYSDKEDFKDPKIIVTNSFTAVADYAEPKKQFCFQISAENPIVLSAASEAEKFMWMARLGEVIAQNSDFQPGVKDLPKEAAPNWSLISDDHIMICLRSIDRAEKIELESCKMLHLSQMSEIINRMRALQNAPSLPEHQLDADRIQAYEKRLAMYSDYTVLTMKKDPQLIAKVEQNAASYMAYLTGYQDVDFRIV